jgi:competence protein ComEA
MPPRIDTAPPSATRLSRWVALVRPHGKVFALLLAALVFAGIGWGAKRAEADLGKGAEPIALAFDAGPGSEGGAVTHGGALASVPSPAAVAVPAATVTAVTAHGPATPESPVYLNTATLDDLRRLPGVGPKRAEAILALRTQKGRFRSVEELMRVKGIGRSTMRKLRPLMRIEAPTQSDAGVTEGHVAR